jgi:hypothetical protein
MKRNGTIVTTPNPCGAGGEVDSQGGTDAEEICHQVEQAQAYEDPYDSDIYQ